MTTATAERRHLDWMLIGSVRLAQRVNITEAGCAEFVGALNSRGYGCISIDGKRYLTHRVAYEATFGLIPAGLTIDHLCENKKCCNPYHLEAVTDLENKRRSPRFNKTHCTHGHPLTPDNVRVTSRSADVVTKDCKACGRARRECVSFTRRYLDREPTKAEVSEWLDKDAATDAYLASMIVAAS